MKKIIGVISNHREEAVDFLKELIGEMKFKDVKTFTINANKCEAELSDGTIYKVVVANGSSRGHRFSDLYLQDGIDQDFLNGVVLPSLVPCNGETETTITYF